MTLLARWRAAWRELGAQEAGEGLFRRLVACYSEPHRKYHTMQHLNECFAHLESVRSVAERPAEVELALWFHDAIYRTTKKDNEEHSAEWARDSALAGGLSNDRAARIFGLAMVTKHNAIPFVRGDFRRESGWNSGSPVPSIRRMRRRRCVELFKAAITRLSLACHGNPPENGVGSGISS